jgi:protein O-GlcNAc transferase
MGFVCPTLSIETNTSRGWGTRVRFRRWNLHLRIEMWGTLVSLILLGMGLPGLGQGTKAAGGAGSQAGVSPALQRADVAFKAGYAAVQAGKLEEALGDFRTAVKLAPQLAEGHLALAATLMQLKRPAEAVPELQKALKLKAGDAAGKLVIEENLAVAHEGYGRQLAAKGKLPEAEGEIRAAVTACGETRDEGQGTNNGGPAAGCALLEDELGSVLAQQAKWAEAEAAFREALGMLPAGGDARSAGMHLHLGIALVEEKRAAEGVEELTQAVAGLPGNSGGRALAEFQLGRALAAAGRDEEAVTHFEETVRINPNFPRGNLELGMAVQRLGRQADSVPMFEKAVAAEPKNVQALTNLGLALAESGRGVDGEVYLRRALAEAPKDPLIYQDLGVAELQESHFDEAIAEFGRAIGLDGGNSQLHYDLGLTYKLKDRPEDAIEELKKASELDASLPDPPYTLGILYMQMGKLGDAEVALRRALELRPANGDGWAVLGSVLKQAGKTQDAEVALRKAVELLPEQPGAHITLAGVLAEEGKKDEAAEQRKVAAGLSRSAVNHQRAMLSTNAGNQAMERGQIGEAVGRFQEAIAADPGFAEAHRRLAEAYERQGRVEDAKAERALAGK